MTVLYDVNGRKYKVYPSDGISIENKIWKSEVIKIDYEEYEKFYKLYGDKKVNKNNFIHIKYGDLWYKIKDDMTTMFMEQELYTSNFYRNHIKEKIK